MVYPYLIALGVGLLALAVAAYLLFDVRRLPVGTPEMAEKAKIIQQGADAFMITEYKVIAPVVAVIALLFSLFIEKSLGLAILLGALMSSAACLIGMKGAIYSGVRTTNAARTTLDIGQTMKVALKGGSVAGFSVQACALIGFASMQLAGGGIDLQATGHGFLLDLLCNPTLQRVASYSLGCSIVAMFNRVAGGNYTKAADISADTVAKVRLAKSHIKQKFAHYQREQVTKQLAAILETGLDEDSFLNPSVLADFIGDCVSDIAGNCSDLLESFVATVSASFLVAYATCAALGDYSYFTQLTMYPTLLASLGQVSSVGSLPFALRQKATERPAHAVDTFTNMAAIFTFIGSVGIAFFCFQRVALPSFAMGWISPVVASFSGIASGIAIGKITEYYTSGRFTPVRRLAESAKEGTAFVVTLGDAIGSASVLLPCIAIGLSLYLSDAICGDYGVAVASLGMLSCVGSTVSIDAFGPIADNAGGLAEACQLDHKIRAITDQLDALGNTTAAVGKGYAIGSAASASVSLFKAFIAAGAVAGVSAVGGTASNIATGISQSSPSLNIASTPVVAGLIIGAAIIEYFIALLTRNTIDSATKMADESEAQLMGGVLAGTKAPDYIRCIIMATREALRKMVQPSLIAVIIPIVVGFLFGNQVLGGLLVGSIAVAIPRAIFMGNSGGAFDNGKKAIETGMVEGAAKGSEAHVATVIGDTIGDTRKDVVGVALDIFIKTMSTIANLIAPITAVYCLF